MSRPLGFVWRGSEEHYKKVYTVFREKTGEICEIVDSLRCHLPSAMKNIDCEKLYDGINILSIGSGDGDIDLEILKILYNEIQRKAPTLNPIKMLNRVVEPQESKLSLYKTKTGKLQNELSHARLVFDIGDPKTFEEYSVEVKDPVPFDIVHFIHSFYSFSDLEGTLKYCYENELSKKGIIVLVLIGKDDTLELARQCLSNVGHLGSEVNGIARRNGWRYEVHAREYTIDVTEVFDEHSTQGNLLLDFFAHIMEFRVNSKPETVALVLETIKNNSTFTDGGKILAKSFVDTHFIFK